MVIPPYLFSAFNLLDVLLLGFSFTAFVLHLKIAVQIATIQPENRAGQVFVNAYQIADDKLLFVRRVCVIVCQRGVYETYCVGFTRGRVCAYRLDSSAARSYWRGSRCCSSSRSRDLFPPSSL